MSWHSRDAANPIVPQWKLHICYMSFVLLFFSGPHLWHMEVPGLVVKSELHLRPTPQPQQRWTLNPPIEARD